MLIVLTRLAPDQLRRCPHWDLARGALKRPHFPDMTGGSVTAAQDEQQHEAAAAGLDQESARLLAMLASNIRLFRSQRGMTRRRLAEQSGVSLPHLARLESSQGNVSVVGARQGRAGPQPAPRQAVSRASSSPAICADRRIPREQPANRLTEIARSCSSSSRRPRPGTSASR